MPLAQLDSCGGAEGEKEGGGDDAEPPKPGLIPSNHGGTMAAGGSKKRAYRERHIAAGLCTECPRPALPGAKRCAACIASQRRCQSTTGARSSKRSAACRVCRGPLPEGRWSYCSEECRRASCRNGYRPRPGDVPRADEYVPEYVACGVCCDLPHRRGDVRIYVPAKTRKRLERQGLDAQGWRRTGDVCPGCGLVREEAPALVLCVTAQSAAGLWDSAIPEVSGCRRNGKEIANMDRDYVDYVSAKPEAAE